MKAQIDSGERPEAPARGMNSTSATPKKKKANVSSPMKEKTLGGRIGKSLTGTPSKKRDNTMKGIKTEPESRYDLDGDIHVLI